MRDVPQLSRETVAAAAEALIALLDELDPNPDCEPDDEGTCEASDDHGTSRSVSPFAGLVLVGDGQPGDPDDAEDDDPDHEHDGMEPEDIR